MIDRQFAINLSRGLEVLRAFTPADQLLGNRDLCDRTSLPKATISRLTYTLEKLGYLLRVERLQKYRLGPGVLMLGYPMLSKNLLIWVWRWSAAVLQNSLNSLATTSPSGGR